MTKNYNQLLDQPEMGQTLNRRISSHTNILGHTNHNGAMLEPPESKGCHPASQ